MREYTVVAGPEGDTSSNTSYDVKAKSRVVAKAIVKNIVQKKFGWTPVIRDIWRIDDIHVKGKITI